MPRVNDLIREHLVENAPGLKRLPPLASLRKTERSRTFEQYRANRKITGAARYGVMGRDKGLDRISCMIRRLKEYRDDRNAEHLVDVANLSELEFVEGRHRGVLSLDDTSHTPKE